MYKFHGWACKVSTWFSWTWMYEVPMDERARLARGSYWWRTRGSHGRECIGFHGWACEISTWFPWTYMYEVSMDDVREIHGWSTTRRKRPIGKGKLGGLVRDPRREVSKPRKRQWLTHVSGSLTWSFSKVLSQNWYHAKVEICWLVAYLWPQYLKDLLVAVSLIRLLLADDVMLNVMEKISTMRMWLKLEC